MESDNTEKQTESQVVVPENQESSRNPDGTFKPGVSGNPNGRPPGKSIKTLVREYLEEHPEAMNKFVEYFAKENRDLAWQMLEGRPQQDVTTDGEKITPILVKFIDGKEPDNSNPDGV